MRRSLVSLAVVAGLILTGCGSGPPQLPLNASGAATNETAAADMSMRVANIRYELADGVKADKDKQNAYKQEGASRDDADRLAKAFGVTGEVRSDEGGWNVGATGEEPAAPNSKGNVSLYLSKNGSWSMNGSFPVSSGVACAEARPAPDAPADQAISSEPCETTTTTINPNLPSEAEARKIAEDKLRAAGIDTDGMRVTVERFDQIASVRFQPTFEGHVVDGYEYAVTINPERGVAYANGYVGDMKSVGTYDLATLERAVERLNEQFNYGGATDTRSLAAEATDPVSPDIAPDIAPEPGTDQSEPTVVKLTAVRVGLMMSFDDKDQSLWLTPAYAFSTDDNGTVLAAAADDKYLPPPTTVPSGDGDEPGVTEPAPIQVDPGTGGGSTGDPGSVEPAPPSPSNCASTTAPIAAQVCSDKTSYKAGETVVFSITASDSDRAFVNGPCYDGVSPEYGDNDGGEATCMACDTGVADGPGKIQRERQHTYAKAGTYTAKFTIKSGSQCAGAHPNDSTVTLSLPVRVA
jgi:hypothetical protein